MDEFARRVFLIEVNHQCNFALASYSAIEEAIRTDKDVRVVFYHVQSLLVSAANVSKIFWPGAVFGDAALKNACRERAEELRRLLNINETSPLRSRELRDHFEHFDERIQKWLNRPGQKNFFDSSILLGMSPEQFIGTASGPLPRDDQFRIYMTPPPVVRFWGNDYALDPIVAALQSLKKKIPEIDPMAS